MKEVPLTQQLFQGAISVAQSSDGLTPWRLPHTDLALFPSVEDKLVQKASCTSGVRLRFQTDAARVALAVVPLESPRRFDLTIDGELVESVCVAAGQDRAAWDALPAGVKVVELWLPTDAPVTVRGLRVDSEAGVQSVADTRPKWLAYGSSITHCGGAHSPARSWPAVAARRAGLNLTCLGYGGSAHLDPMVARMIRDLQADFISLKVGINICGLPTLTERTFRPALIGFIQIIREKHPEIPIAVVSLIYAPAYERGIVAPGFPIDLMREQIQDAVGRLSARGDGNLHYFSGLDLLGPDMAEQYLTEDGVHPNGDGYEAIGRNFLQRVLAQLPLP